MSIPGWYELLLITGASYRVWRLLSQDIILDRPRRWVLRLGDWQEGDPSPPAYRHTLGDFLECPACAGFWIGVITWGFWQIWPHATLVICALFTINTLVIVTRSKLDPPD